MSTSNNWNEAIEACKKVAEKWLESFMGGEAYVARSIVTAIEALRRNEPPDTSAGKSADAGDGPQDTSEEERIDQLRLTAFTSGSAENRQAYFAAASKWFQDRHYRRMDAERMPPHGWADAGVGKAVKEVGTWLRGALDCKEWHWDADQHEAAEDAYKALQAALSNPVAANASAEARWRSISKDTSWVDGRDVVLLANDMEVQARYCPGEWCDETPSSPREYSGAVWSCFDDRFQLEIEECSEDPSEWCHDGATHWRQTSELPSTVLPDHGGADAGPTSAFEVIADHFGLKKKAALSKPAPVAANASAEARLREALEKVQDLTDSLRSCVVVDAIRKELGEALSTHPHASDCDKQGER